MFGCRDFGPLCSCFLVAGAIGFLGGFVCFRSIVGVYIQFWVFVLSCTCLEELDVLWNHYQKGFDLFWFRSLSWLYVFLYCSCSNLFLISLIQVRSINKFCLFKNKKEDLVL